MNRIKVRIEEEQEILREAYKTVLSQEPSIELVGCGDGAHITKGDVKGTEAVLLQTNPDILVIGTKLVQSNTISGLETIRRDFSQIGIVLLSAHFDAESIGKLKGFARNSKRGAYLLKASISTGRELIRAIHDVSEGRVIVDPQVFAGLIQDSDISNSNIAGLTARELEVLGWLAMGYRNSAIAQVLCLEPKTVERHISNIFSKLSNGDAEVKHPRVDAVLAYFRATGQLQLSACN
ncbi:MAG: response regulator transcription factor [Dehalococcoidia bacterium]|nr:response regulator transcription factor [Dehalococcoidia bacterium]